MGATSYTAQIGSAAWPRAGGTRQWEAAGLVGAALLMAVGAGFGVATMLMGGARINEAAARTAEMTGKYHRLHEADFEQTLFPVAEGIGGLGTAAGYPAPCGVVISGIDTSRGGAVVKWQRSHGSCAATRMGRGETAMLPAWAVQGGGAVAVEVFSSSMPSMVADREGYAVSFAAPAGGVVPMVVSKSGR